MNSGKVLLGILAGVAAGATLGILFAPDKGSSTRKKIQKKGEDYAEELGDKFNDFISAITNQYDTLKQDATQIVENGKSKVEKIEAEMMHAKR